MTPIPIALAAATFAVPSQTLLAAYPLEFGLGLRLGLRSEEVFVFDSKSENKDRAVKAVESVSEARAV